VTQISPNHGNHGNWITIAVVAFATVGFLMLSFLPKMQSISDEQRNLDDKLEYVLHAQKSVRASDELQRELDLVLAYIEKHDDQLIAEEELPALYSKISLVAKAHSAITTKFEPLPSTPYDSFRKASLRLGVNGSFAAIYGLVKDLESLDTQIWVEDLKFRGFGETGKPEECDMLLVVFVDNPEKTD
jgi:Tfp pilus assembly protein PilO